MSRPERNYVDGSWTEASGGDTVEVRNPADTTEVVAEYQQSTAADAADAVAAAAAAQPDWAAASGAERGQVLRDAASALEERKDELTEQLTREEGKTLSEAAPEVQRAVDIFYYYAEKAIDAGGRVKQASGGRTNLYTRREPLGVAGLVTPWNYPIAIPAWKIAPALATGNAVVCKPAEIAPGVALEIARALDDAGIPDGVLNVVTGPGSEVGEAIVEHDDVDVVSFTGSSTVGHMVYDQATDAGKRAQAEMGGKNPAVVASSADVDRAVEIVGAGAFGVTGQACTATSRAIVHTDLYDEFVDGIVDHAESLTIGHGSEDPDVGPHVSESELEGTLEYVEIGESEGATLETGGRALEDGEYADGYFVEPAVFSDVESDMQIAQEEIFGPVLSVIEAESFEDALGIANDSDYGLSAGIVSEDHAEIQQFVSDVESGVVKVNEKTTGLELHVPFGGVKDSSTNTYREQGDAAIDFFTQTKTVYVNE